jgi:hypothetical protein
MQSVIMTLLLTTTNFVVIALVITSPTTRVLLLTTSRLVITLRPVRLAYQPPASSTFLSEQTSQQYFSLTTNQHQPSATSQTNRLLVCATAWDLSATPRASLKITS